MNPRLVLPTALALLVSGCATPTKAPEAQTVAAEAVSASSLAFRIAPLPELFAQD